MSDDNIFEWIEETAKVVRAAKEALSRQVMIHHPPLSDSQAYKRCELCKSLNAITLALHDFELNYGQPRRKP